MAKVTYTQRELDLIEEAKKNTAHRNGASKPVFDESGVQIGVEGQPSAPQPTVVGDTLYGSGRSPSAAMPAGMETRALPGGGTVTAAPSVLDAPSALPAEEYRVRSSAAPKTVAESVSVLQREWNKFNNETAAKAASFVPDGLLRSEAGAGIRPLAEFKAESDWNEAEDRRAQGEMSRARQESALRRSNRVAIRRSIGRGDAVNPELLQKATDQMTDSNRVFGGKSVDDNLQKFRDRRNPFLGVRRRSFGTSAPSDDSMTRVRGVV